MTRIASVILLTVLLQSSLLAEGKAPDFTLPTMEGNKFKLSEALKSGPVLVDFWATWCKPCIQELPYVNQLDSLYKHKGLTVVAITIDSPKSQAKVKPFIKGAGYRFEVLLDIDSEVRRKFGGKDIPFVALISQDGQIVYSHLGYNPGDEKTLKQKVEELLAKSSK